VQGVIRHPVHLISTRLTIFRPYAGSPVSNSVDQCYVLAQSNLLKDVENVLLVTVDISRLSTVSCAQLLVAGSDSQVCYHHIAPFFTDDAACETLCETMMAIAQLAPATRAYRLPSTFRPELVDSQSLSPSTRPVHSACTD